MTVHSVKISWNVSKSSLFIYDDLHLWRNCFLGEIVLKRNIGGDRNDG